MITKEIEELQYFENALRYYCREAGCDLYQPKVQDSQRELARPFMAIKALVTVELNASLGFATTWLTGGGGSLVLSPSSVVSFGGITANGGTGGATTWIR